MLMVSVPQKKSECKKTKGRRLENQSIVQVNGLQATFRKKGRSISSSNNKNEEKGYRKAAECYPRAEVANVSHTIAQKGAFNSEKKVTPLALPSPGAVKVNHFSDSLFAPTPPLPAPFNTVPSTRIGFKIPLNGPI